MSLQVAIQMDPIDSIDIDRDSSFVLALEAQKRGYKLYHYLPEHLSLIDGKVIARARALTVQRKLGDHFTLGDFETIDLKEMGVVLMRQDPPFDMAYLTATYLLELIHPYTLVVNDPTHVRNAPEKIFVTNFPNLMPATLISRDIDQIVAFREKYEDIILKPLYGNGGAAVFHISPGDENLSSLMEMFTERNREPVIAQAYLPDVRKGDKRIILVDGIAVGAINRVPKEGEARSNMHVGGQAFQSTLSEREKEICNAIGPALKERGLIFVGIDVIGDYLTEINVTSPTGLQEINRYDDVCLEATIWDAIENRLN
ncbi:MAG: glutathione synthase [Rhodospirillales bacterium]|jgi:glutathione synthase